MCAINGFNFRNKDLILEMNRLTSHRGPDGSGFFADEEISLGHNRLAIIDLSDKASQPMWDEKRELAVVFNGEIYNFKELRRDLEKKYRFKSNSDTEVILYAYKEYGLECLNKFNGIFAFAIWDAAKKELILARDRMGIKPLYYYHDNKKFIFSSEIKAILTHDIPRQVDYDAFNLYFHVLYVPEPYTMFANIKKLPAASFLKLRGSDLTIKKYWEVDDFSNVVSKNEAVEKISELFKDAVKKQLISDRPVGIFLSGGLDSTAVLGAAREASGERPKTFSVGFDVKESFDKFNADFLLARETAKFYKTDHHELFISPKDFIENIDKLVWHLDEPNFNPTAGAIFLLSKMAKEKVAVVLGGDGGDELFGGYPRYYFSRLISYFQGLPQLGRIIVKSGLGILGKKDLLAKLGQKSGAEKILTFLSQKQDLLCSAINNDFVGLEPVIGYFNERYFNVGRFGKDFEKYFMNMDRQSWLVDESLARTDKMTMAWGLEQRVPILDYRLVELANKIPTSWKISILRNKPSDFKGKDIWRAAIGKYLFPHIVSQRKRGWFTPMAKWIRADLRGFVSEILSPNSLNSDLFNAEEIGKIWKDHLSGKRYNLNLIWAIVMWQLWYNKFIKSGKI